MNKYMELMLCRARDLTALNLKELECPFCTADRREYVFRERFPFGVPGEDDEDHDGDCAYCPMTNLAPNMESMSWLMGDCVAFGKEALDNFEEFFNEVKEDS